MQGAVRPVQTGPVLTAARNERPAQEWLPTCNVQRVPHAHAAAAGLPAHLDSAGCFTMFLKRQPYLRKRAGTRGGEMSGWTRTRHAQHATQHLHRAGGLRRVGTTHRLPQQRGTTHIHRSTPLGAVHSLDVVVHRVGALAQPVLPRDVQVRIDLQCGSEAGGVNEDRTARPP